MTKINRPTNPKLLRVGMLSLGCPKTLVDSEVILGKFDKDRYRLAPSVAQCDIALINTCAFIHDAQKESIERILELIELKKKKRIRALIVLGCLVQGFSDDLRKAFRGVDAFIGSGEYDKLPRIIESVLEGKKIFLSGHPGYLASAGEPRISLTPSYSRYLKISEGCDHRCSFCTIPVLRGKHRSRTIADIVEEAKNLVAEGAREIILTGQDTTYFGRDFDGAYHLPDLLRQLDKIRGVEWIRLLYTYPSCVTTELMKVIRDSRHICHYLDMPLQHASDRILRAMRRGITRKRTIDLIRRFRSYVGDLAIRTTLIVGFPGETQKDFRELLDFVKEMRFDRLGVFPYSRERDSEAAGFLNQVPEKVKKERLKRIMLVQQEISKENNRFFLGKTLRVLMEEPSRKQPGFWIGRTYRDAPEIDGNVFVKTDGSLRRGTFYSVQIIRANEYDLVGQL